MEKQLTSYSITDDTMVVKLARELDHHNSVPIREEIDRQIYSGKIRNIIFDFENTTFMDSSGIGIIVGRYKKISCFGGKVYAVHTGSRIRRILLLAGVENIVEIME